MMRKSAKQFFRKHARGSTWAIMRERQAGARGGGDFVAPQRGAFEISLLHVHAFDGRASGKRRDPIR